MVKIFQMVSLLCMTATALSAGVLWVIHKQRNLLKIITAGIYLALLCLYIPHFYVQMQGEMLGYVGISSLYGALRVFLLDQEFDLILKLAAENQLWGGQWYVNYVSFLFVMAPLLTFSNVLSLFRNAADRLRFVTRLGGTMYVLSELNPHSMTMAESIRKERPHALIVFTDVGRKRDTGLIDRARELNAVCISKDIAHIRFWNNFQKKQIFLISEDEAENVTHGIALTQRYKERRQKMAVYVYASMPDSNEAINMLDKGTRVLNRNFRNYLKKNLESILNCDDWKIPKIQMEGNFSIRCVDPVEQTVLELLKKNYLTIHGVAKEQKRISITILGFRYYGRSFLKTAAWIYQLYGYQIEFNVFDADASVYGRFAQEAPELAENRSRKTDDAQHDIRFFTGIDCLSSALDDQITKQERERLARTQLVFTALGDDSKNITAAIRVRELFLRQKIAADMREIDPENLTEEKEKIAELEERAKQYSAANEMPVIYAVVTDEKRAANLDPQSMAASDFKRSDKQPYHICPVGTLSEVYAYDRILEMMQAEKQAFACHVGWVIQAYRDPKNSSGESGTDKEKKLEELIEVAEKYVDSSYFRNSSVATQIHQTLLQKITEDLQAAHGEDLEKVLDITEHMRWNAYMRGLGYRYCAVRCSRAKLHKDLLPYSELNKFDQKKDRAVREKEAQNV